MIHLLLASLVLKLRLPRSTLLFFLIRNKIRFLVVGENISLKADVIFQRVILVASI